MNEPMLFDVPKNRTRRSHAAEALRAWKAKHGVTTYHSRHMLAEEEPWTALVPGVTIEDVAWSCVTLEEEGKMLFGRSERQACERLAESIGIEQPWKAVP